MYFFLGTPPGQNSGRYIVMFTYFSVFYIVIYTYFSVFKNNRIYWPRRKRRMEGRGENTVKLCNLTVNVSVLANSWFVMYKWSSVPQLTLVQLPFSGILP